MADAATIAPVELEAMPLVTADKVNDQAPSAIIVISPPTKLAGGVMMFVAVVPVTWKKVEGAIMVAAEATAAPVPMYLFCTSVWNDPTCGVNTGKSEGNPIVTLTAAM